MPKPFLALLATTALTACQSLPGADTPAVAAAASDNADTAVFTVEVDRAYTLEDPREDAFRAQIRTAAQENCGPGSSYAIYAQSPVGDEVIGPEFLFRRYEITFACTG